METLCLVEGPLLAVVSTYSCWWSRGPAAPCFQSAWESTFSTFYTYVPSPLYNMLVNVTRTIVTNLTFLCTLPLVGKVALLQNSSAGHPPVLLDASLGPSHKFSPAGFGPPMWMTSNTFNNQKMHRPTVTVVTKPLTAPRMLWSGGSSHEAYVLTAP